MIMQNTSSRFIDTGLNPGAYNMQLDERLARELLAGTGMPTLRLFRWQPWAISIGYNQSLDDIDLKKCDQDGIDVVRRPTGGRAILHAEEITYSIVMPAGTNGILQIYNEISKALVVGLRMFGAEVSLQRSQPNYPEEYRRASSVACFTSSARYEIEWKGRKLVGSAQRRFNDGVQDIVLQHGSILCGPAHKRLAEYVNFDDRAKAVGFERELNENTVDLSQICDQPIDIGSLSTCIKRGFEMEWGIMFQDEPAPHKHDVVAQLSTS